MSVRTLSLEESPAPLGLDPIKRRDPLTLRGPVASGIFAGYRARFWRRPTDAPGGTPLAAAEGTIVGEEAFIDFTGPQMELTLTADDGYHDHFWVTISGTQENTLEGTVLRRGWLRMKAAGCDGAVT